MKKKVILLIVILIILTALIVIQGCASLNPIVSSPMPGLNKRVGSLTLAAVGDIAHSVGYSYSDRSFALGAKKYRYVKKYFTETDLAFANLEAPFTNIEPVLDKAYPFSSPPSELGYIHQAGLNMYSLANNHTYDAGILGIRDTMNNLARLQSASNGRQIYWAGAGNTTEEAVRPKVFYVNGQKIVFFAFGNNNSDYVNTYDQARAVREVNNARNRHGDALIIVSVHTGVEYQHVPTPGKVSNFRQLVNSGASIVLGHHPHVIQGIEKYKEGIIFYSLGNFSFTSMTARHKKTGAKLYSMIAGMNLEKRGDNYLVQMTVIPLYVDNANPMSVGGKVLQPKSFQPFVPPQPFSDVILSSFIKWNSALSGNRINFIKQDGYMRTEFFATLNIK
jgi:poly-gamma-glutamate capsule biosynthesis protein CapA/YwtB (metallophosphatase superfamily)